MPDSLLIILKNYHDDVKKIFGSALYKVILYGSYARGDFKQDSDIDIMILADVHPEEVSKYADKVYDITYDYEMQYDMEINPVVQSIQTYEKWKKTYPFFMSIEKEGIAV